MYSLDDVHIHSGIPGKTLPLKITPLPDGECSPEFLGKWLKKNKKWVHEQLVLFGAVKFSGFGVEIPQDVEDVLMNLDKLSDEYRGTSPRVVQGSTQYVFSASELPGFFPIPQHLEMSFLNEPPARLYFSCLDDSFTKETPRGGETCLCDFRKVWAEMDDDLKRKFKNKGVLNIRNYNKEKPAIPLDFFKLKPWKDLFFTTDKAEVDAECEASGLTATWGDSDNLRLANAAGATRVHPKNNIEIFSNHCPTFHVAMGPQEFDRTWRRTGQVKILALWLLMAVFTSLYRAIMPWVSYGMHVCFADGEAITDEEMEHVRDLIWKHMVFPAWRNGDILMIDNHSVSHGRQPFQGKRKVVVSWAGETQGIAPLPPAILPSVHATAKGGSGVGAEAALLPSSKAYASYFKHAQDLDEEAFSGLRESSYETAADSMTKRRSPGRRGARARSTGRKGKSA